MTTRAQREKGGRAFAPARIAGLVVIGLVVAALGWLRLSSGDDAVTVPSGAKAGDLTLHDCRYETEGGGYAADCGTLVVPENRHEAGSRLIALPVTRVRARSAEPVEPIFRLQGGPGITNMAFPAASRFADEHDIVLVGYRGVDGSSRLDCPEVTSAREQARGFLTESAMRADAAAFEDCAERLQDQGVDLAGYTLPQRVDDLDAARKALGYEHVDLLSESAGTRTAMIYAWRYPKRIRSRHERSWWGVSWCGSGCCASWRSRAASRPGSSWSRSIPSSNARGWMRRQSWWRSIGRS